MKAIVFDDTLRYIEDHPLPELNRPDEALIRVRMAGARLKTVNRKTIWSKTETSAGSSPFSRPSRMDGKRISAALEFWGKTAQSNSTNIKISRIRLHLFRAMVV